MSLSMTDWLNSLDRPTEEPTSPCEKKRGDCLKVIQYILDGEASPEQQIHFNEHIVECLPCIEQYNLDKSIKLAIQTKISQKQVPVNLIEEIKNRINYLA